MATVAQLKGSSKAFQTVSKSTANALVDRKTFEASTKAKGMPAVPADKKATGGNGAVAPGKAKVAPTHPPVAKQVMEAVGNKGGRVDQQA